MDGHGPTDGAPAHPATQRGRYDAAAGDPCLPRGWGPVSGMVTLDATATDNVAVVGLQYQLDGANLGGEQAQAPYQQAWDTSTTAPGPHTLTVSVRDAAGNYSTSAPVTVTVGAPVTPTVAGTIPLACVGVMAEGGGAVAVACVPQGQEGRR